MIDKCKARVCPPDRWGAFHPHQCKRKAVRDGFCNTHHPENIEKRYEERAKKWQRESENSPITILSRQNTALISAGKSAIEFLRQCCLDDYEHWKKLDIEIKKASME